jgi:hypothetical protein
MDQRTAPGPTWTRPVVVPVFLVVSLVGGALPSFSLGANLLTVAAGGALVWLAMSGRVPRVGGPDRLTRRAAWWLVPALGFALVELVDFGLGSTGAHPTLSILADPVLARYPARAAAYFCWLVGFWGLVRR